MGRDSEHTSDITAEEYFLQNLTRTTVKMVLERKKKFVFILVILSATGKNLANGNPRGEIPGLRKGTTRVKRADDLSLSELNTLVQQQVQAIQTLQSQHAADEQKIQSLTATVQNLQSHQSALEQSLPSAFAQVAFTAHFTTDSHNDGVHLNSHQVLEFDSVVTNIGNGYNPQTGIFTAPVAGTYAFFLSLMGTAVHDPVWLAITKQGKVLDIVYAQGSSDVNDQGSGMVTTHLAVGEQAWVRQNGGDAVRGSWYTVFTGYLVQADKQ